jgi:hypothetical protein
VIHTVLVYGTPYRGTSSAPLPHHPYDKSEILIVMNQISSTGSV